MLHEPRTEEEQKFLDTVDLKDALYTALATLSKDQKNIRVTDPKFPGAVVTVGEIIIAAIYNSDMAK